MFAHRVSSPALQPARLMRLHSACARGLWNAAFARDQPCGPHHYANDIGVLQETAIQRFSDSATRRLSASSATHASMPSTEPPLQYTGCLPADSHPYRSRLAQSE